MIFLAARQLETLFAAVAIAAAGVALVPVGTAAASAPAASAPARSVETPPPAAPFAPGEAIVRFEPGTRASERRAAREAAGVDFERPVPILGTQVVAVDGAVGAAVRRLARQPDVAYAQPNYRYRALAVAQPDDTFFDDLWGLSDFATPDRGVDALAAWEATTGAGQVVAVVDTGVDLSHPDLQANLWQNPDEAVDESDGDGNGKADDVNGYDFVDLDADPDDYNDHGTHVAGTAAAVAGNGLGIAGVAPDADIMAVRVLDGNGSGFTDDIAAGIRYAAEEGADAVNLSLGGPAGDGDQAMADAVAAARDAGAVVVAAAGNSGADNDTDPHSPCVLPEPTDGTPLDNLICVAATDRDGNLAVFSANSGSNWGATTVHVGAPGVDIRSAVTDYVARFHEGFESDLDGWTVESPWARTDEHASRGSFSLADSPGGDYGPNTDIQAVAPDLDLSSEADCRMRFYVRLDTEGTRDASGDYVDRLIAGALIGGDVHGVQLAGSTGGGFSFVEFPLDEAAGDAAVAPLVWFQSDDSEHRDGAHVDRLALLCRDGVYRDDDYWRFSGTSMAAPHVAGVVALARAAAVDAGSDAGAGAIVDAVLAGTNTLDGLGDKTVTGGIVDACLAIGEARGTPGDCGTAAEEPEPEPGDGGDDGGGEDDGGTEDGGTDEGDGTDGGDGGTEDGGGTEDDGSTDTDPGGTPTTGDATGEPAVSPLVRPSLRRSRRWARVRRSGRFAYAFVSPRHVRGVLALRTARRVRVSLRRPRLRRHLGIAVRRFVVGERRRVVLRFRLSPRQRRILRLNRRLVLRVAVRVRAADGRTAGAARLLVLR